MSNLVQSLILAVLASTAESCMYTREINVTYINNNVCYRLVCFLRTYRLHSHRETGTSVIFVGVADYKCICIQSIGFVYRHIRAFYNSQYVPQTADKVSAS